MSVQTVMTALADEVRELSGETGQLSLEGMTDAVAAGNEEVSGQTALISQIVSALRAKFPGINDLLSVFLADANGQRLRTADHMYLVVNK